MSLRVLDVVEMGDLVLLLETKTLLRVYKQEFGTVTRVYRQGDQLKAEPTATLPGIVVDRVIELLRG